MAILLGGYTPLMLAAEAGDLGGLSAADPNTLEVRSKPGFTALALAVKSSQTAAVKQLLGMGANAKTTTNVRLTQAGQSLALLAVASQHLAALPLVVAAGCDVNAPDNHGWTPMMLAVTRDLPEIVAELLRLGADVRNTDKVKHMQAGKKAADRCKSESVRRLLSLAELDLSIQQERVELDRQRKEGQSAVTSAAGDLPAVSFSKYESERRFTRDMLRYASTGIISHTVKRVDTAVNREKLYLDQQLQTALQRLLINVNRVLEREVRFLYEGLRRELFVELDNFMREQGHTPFPSAIRDAVPNVLLGRKVTTSPQSRSTPPGMLAKLYGTKFQRVEWLNVPVQQACRELVQHYSAQLYEHLSTVVGEEAWHTLAEVCAKLKQAVDRHIQESMEQIESQVQGALQSVLRQRISELLR